MLLQTNNKTSAAFGGPFSSASSVAAKWNFWMTNTDNANTANAAAAAAPSSSDTAATTTINNASNDNDDDDVKKKKEKGSSSSSTRTGDLDCCYYYFHLHRRDGVICLCISDDADVRHHVMNYDFLDNVGAKFTKSYAPYTVTRARAYEMEKRFRTELGKIVHYYNENRSRMVRNDKICHLLGKVDDLGGYWVITSPWYWKEIVIWWKWWNDRNA